MDRDELMDALDGLIENRKRLQKDLHEASIALLHVEKEIDTLIDQLQPRIEVTKPAPLETVEWKRPEPETPSERVHDALLHAGRRLSTAEITLITGLGRRQVGPALGVLVKANRIRNVGNGTWAAA